MQDMRAVKGLKAGVPVLLIHATL